MLSADQLLVPRRTRRRIETPSRAVGDDDGVEVPVVELGEQLRRSFRAFAAVVGQVTLGDVVGAVFHGGTFLDVGGKVVVALITAANREVAEDAGVRRSVLHGARGEA